MHDDVPSGRRELPSPLPVGVLPALCLVSGAVVGTFTSVGPSWPAWSLPPLCIAAGLAWHQRRLRLACAALVMGFFATALALAADARIAALEPSLRAVLHERFGGFALHTLGPEPDHEPLVVEARLIEDAAPADGFVSMRARVTGLGSSNLHPVDGVVGITVSGALAASRFGEWRAGRTIRMYATFRRPARYLNEGVPDFERDLALGGTTLFASVKSGLLVDIVDRGTALEEAAARGRARVRRAVAARVGRHDAVSAAIVTAVLIGDRTGLPPAIRERLQAAGTYHVIAISGGNIAILAGVAVIAMALAGVRGRFAAVLAIAVLAAYALVVAAGPSVWRATLMAVLYFTGRALDLRVPAWHVAAMAAAVMVVAHPLDVRDPGFLLTFGATAALLEAGRRARTSRPATPALAWVRASVAASLAAEVALLPVSAQVFMRVTAAGLLLNLLAVPLMTVVQLAGMAVVLGDGVNRFAQAAGLLAHLAASALVGSARLVQVAPWLVARVPPPGILLVLAYYASLAGVLFGPRRRRPAMLTALGGAALLIVGGVRLASTRDAVPAGSVALTVLDVGQGEALMLQAARGRTLLVDTGGLPFGGGAFDIGTRVLAPALWARGVGRLEALLVTHGDPDHLGGALAVLRDFAPRALWEGVRVPSHRPMLEVLSSAAGRQIPVATLRTGDAFGLGPVRIRVLHPPPPDWERQRVRNDDSVVLEALYGDVAILLTGDISAEVERAVIPHLTPARLRILKVAHHGSRTSSSSALLDDWRPQVALISSGRGNTFGHPAAEVLRRLESINARVFRTDRHGRITLTTDGRTVEVTTYMGER